MIGVDKAMELALEYAKKANLPATFIEVTNVEKSESGDSWIVTLETLARKFEAQIDVKTGELLAWRQKK